MTLFVDCYGTLILSRRTEQQNEALVDAIKKYVTDHKDVQITVWTWGSDEDAAKVAKACFSSDMNWTSQSKAYGQDVKGDIIIDDDMGDWLQYGNGARLMTPEQFIGTFG